MIVELHDGLRNPQKIKATRVVVYDDYGQPIGAVLRVGDGYMMTTREQKGFNESLSILGVANTTVEVTRLPDRPSEISM